MLHETDDVVMWGVFSDLLAVQGCEPTSRNP